VDLWLSSLGAGAFWLSIRGPEELFYLFDQEGYIGMTEAQLGRGETMMLDVRRDMFVMRDGDYYVPVQNSL
jgi:hypothetical protein